MLVTFYSDAYENIIMFGHIAQHLLKLMGHSGTIPGAILAKDIPKALERLQEGLKKSPPIEESSQEEEEPNISLAKRALPLINMLKAANDKQLNVLWK